ncbi:Dual specificity protein phosphatase 26 [Lamellibrachia satsuma]|nr:Dual specificity protein phosphatase 26 [Lamellibrachia satsuma]
MLRALLIERLQKRGCKGPCCVADAERADTTSMDGLSDREMEREYLQKMKMILLRRDGASSSSGPAQLLDHLYIGNKTDACNRSSLKRHKITHVLNCAASKDYSVELVDNPYDAEATGVHGYLEFEALDNESYPILMHFRQAKAFIDAALDQGGRVLVHCNMGINRSGAICVAYIMQHQQITLLQTIRLVKFERPIILCNEGFQKQLIEFARNHELLHRNSTIGAT